MHDLSAQAPRIPHVVRNVPQTVHRQAGYEVELTVNNNKYVAPFSATVTGALDNAELYVLTHFQGHTI